MDYDKNCYYHPEVHGLSVFDEVETAGSYEFDTTVVWEDAEGNLYWAHDSGCSCPTPFESYTSISDLNKLDSDSLHSFDEHLKNQYRITPSQYNNLITKVRLHLKEKQ